MNINVPTRGCGTRVKGGIYAEVLLGEGGLPVEHFLLDPPLVLDFQKLGVAAIGTKLVSRDGVFHVIDMVGASHYPNVADFIEEVRRYGVSRRISRTTDFSKLTPSSRLLLAHPRAFIQNFADYCPDWKFTKEAEAGHPLPRCPKGIPAHDETVPPQFCAGVYWQDVEGGNCAGDRWVERRMPSFQYTAACRPAGVVPEYRPAVFASFPIHRLVSISDSPETDRANAAIMANSKLPTAVLPA